MNTRGCNTGFTLLELLVAIAIFSFLGAAMFTGIRQIVVERELVQARAKELTDIQRAVRYLSNDLSQAHPRRIRDQLGQGWLDAFVTDPSADFALQFTRDGWRNPTPDTRLRGTLQRVQYRFEDGELIREYWTVLDPLLGAEPRQLVLLEDVEDFEMEFLDDQSQWLVDWPPPNTPQFIGASRPRAVRYRFTMPNYGEIERLVELPRVQ